MLEGRMRMRARRLAVGMGAAVALGGALPSAASAVDVFPTNVEVTQAVQTSTNSVLLVARRGTAVRVTVGVTLNPGEARPNVTGRLHVFRNNVRVTPVAGVAPLSTLFSAPAFPDRNNQAHTLNYELPAPTGIASSTNVDFRVDLTVAGDTNLTNNSGFASNLRFVNRAVPRIFFVRVRYTPNGRGFPLNSLIRRGVGDMNVRGILPVNDSSTNLYRPLPFLPDITFNADANNDNQLNGNDLNRLLGDLASLRQVLALIGGVPSNSFIYGWLAGGVAGNGLAQVVGRAGFGNTDPVRHQRSFAHELTHNFGFNHISETLGDTGWDVGARLSGNPGTNNTVGRVKPSTLNDVQVAGLLTNQAWVSRSKYVSLLGNSAFATAVGPGLASAARFSPRVAVIHGIFDAAGQRLIELRPVFRFPWRSEPTPTDRNGPFVAELRTTTGRTIRVPFNAVVGDDQEPGVHTRKGFFEVMVPVTGELSRLRITTRAGDRTFAQLTRGRPPVVRIQSLRRNTTLTGRRTVRWTVSDPDTPESRLRYQVAFSGDGGRTFIPVAVNLSRESAAFDTRRTSARRGRGIFRVFVSDGLNTTFHDVGGLTLRR
jgi:hypothetical protein